MKRRKFFDFAGVAYDEGVIRRIAHNSDHFRLRGIAGDDDMTAVLGRAFRQSLDTSYERTGGIDNPRRALLQFGLNLRRHAVRANYGDLIGGYFSRILNG